jgi:hypothetical protein
MNLAALGLIPLWVLWCAGVYGFPRCSYTLAEGALRMRWRVFRWIPFSGLTIHLSNIAEVRRFELRRDLWKATFVFGRLSRKNGVLIVLKRRWLGIVKSIYTTPQDADWLIDEISRRLANSEDGSA